jgi:16S rRNA (uracil1498-N3)-methyltransferase
VPTPPGPTSQDGPHAFVADLDAPALSDDDDHHLRRVQRLRPGDSLTVSDGAGRWRLARLGAVGAVEADGPIEVVPRPEPAVTVGFAVLKGDRNEWVVQKLTELGVDRIVPLAAERCVVRWDEAKAARQHARLARVAREAAMQSRRCWLPEILPLSSLPDVASRPAVARADRGGEPLTDDVHVVVVGPEGGWTDAERDVIPTAVALGDHVLRAETAAVAAAVLLATNRVGTHPAT